MNKLSQQQWQQVIEQNPDITRLLSPRLNKYIPIVPTPLQAIFLTRSEYEVLYGGAAGGGKSIALLTAALQYVDVPGYNALVLRKTLADLALPGALMSLSKEWLQDTDAKWDSERYVWHFPSGATLTFGYMTVPGDKERYRGSAYQFVAFDELTQFEKHYYVYMFSRMRKPVGLDIPIRMRAATNPGGVGAKWVKERFIENRTSNRIFIPAKLTDNPYIDQESYMMGLNELDPLERAQLVDGSWDIIAQGDFFKRSQFRYITPDMFPNVQYIRCWDLSAQTETRPDSDYVAGALVAFHNGNFYIKDLKVTRGSPGDVEEFVKRVAEEDGHGVPIWIEQEGGSSGPTVVYNYKTRVLAGYSVTGKKPQGNKIVRARTWAGFVKGGACFLPVHADWLEDFLLEADLFPNKKVHDDRIDAISLAVEVLTDRREPHIRSVDGTTKRLDPRSKSSNEDKQVVYRSQREMVAPRLRGWY